MRLAITPSRACCKVLECSAGFLIHQAGGATAAHFNRPFNERLKPGGSDVIADLAAALGAGTSVAQSLHRIEPASVRAAVEATGFVLDVESTMLENKDDPRITLATTDVEGSL